MRITESAAILFVYIALAIAAQVGVFFVRYDFAIPGARLPGLLVAIPVLIGAKGFVFLSLRLYRSWWQMAGIADLIQLLKANAIASALYTAAALTVLRLDIPRSIYVLDFLLCFLLMAGARFSVRVVRELIQNASGAAGRSRILIYGAGTAGVTLLRGIQSKPALRLAVAGLIEDDPKRAKSVILGARVIGTGRDIP